MKENLPIRKWMQIAFMTFSLLGVGTLEVLSQSKPIKGVVKGDDGVALPGVTVVEKSTPSNGTVTDADGNFSISVREGATLVISFIGLKTQEVAVGSQTSIEVTMETDITQLSEVVVIGYGTMKKSDLTGSVVSIGGDDLKKVPVASVAESLTGRLAGVQVTGTEGSPDAEVNIRVRGGGSITQSNQPLYIVDGFPVNSINDITPSDIESINVLKDASSTAIYGSRGANGVIIITTKSGKAGKFSVSYNAFYGFKKIANTLDVLNPQDFVKWQREYSQLRFDSDDQGYYENYFGTWQDRDLFDGLSGNDWQKQIYGRTGVVNSQDISLRGGSDKFSYSMNYALYDEKAIMIGSDFRRNNFTLKLNNKASDKIDIGFSLRYSDTEIRGGGANEQNEVSSADSRLKNSVLYSPIQLPGITNNDTDDQLAGTLINPIIAVIDNDRLQQRRNFNVAGSIGWNILEELNFKSELGFDVFNNIDNRFYGRSTYYVQNVPSSENQGNPAAIIRDAKETRIRSTNTFNYDFKNLLSSDHNLKLLLGHEVIHTQSNQLSTVLHGYPKLFLADQAFKLTTQGVPQAVDNNFSPDDNLLSFFTRATYEYNGKYLLSATYRADASSRFAGNNRWGYFPSAAVGWKISEENFMQGTSNWLDNLKIRFSYGVAGNNGIDRGQTSQAFLSRTTTWINGVTDFWAASNLLANPDLKWETTTTRNAGLDFGIIKSKLVGSFEAYLNNTSDLLIQFPTPGSGYTDQFRNIGETENKGLEASLTYVALEKEKYGLTISANIGINRNKVVSLGELNDFFRDSGWASTDIQGDFKVAVGRPLGDMIGYRSDGRYEVSDFEGYDAGSGNWILRSDVVDGSVVLGTLRPGMMKLRDLDGDGDVTVADKERIGNGLPKHTGGFTLNGYAYGFDLTAAFNYSYGNQVYNANKIEYTTATPRTNYRNLIDIMADGNRWTNLDPATGTIVNDPATLAAMNANTSMWSPYMARSIFSDWAVEDASFLRLNTLSLGYTLPSSLTSKARIQNLRFYATAYNVFVLTPHSGFDPEVSTRRRTGLTPSVDYSAYPRSRQLVFGLNLNF
ncbi:SusC/RagA family protein [Chryseotalea sanaruensis]|uniref:SusC/RagA family protein n=1 Tax=Chryseotalea sanaruensis TaxID=2482724 RepID=A0A401U586_9BACT|nr:TonB-dependent receptor [Chryseotalea sanaruensis]GCC50071.1 SusC/RagA family protein [Chryseotalea sanaruensis]